MRLAALLLAVVALAGPPGANAAIALRDDLGRRVEMPRPAQRIVALAPFLTELAYAAGAGPQMVGASAHSDFPAEARALPQVASALGLSIEAVAALHPDLVLAWQDSIRPEDIARLERFGIAVFVAQARRLDDVPRLLEAIGRLTGRDATGRARAYRASIAALRARHARLQPVTVFLEIWHRPLTTIAGAHWMNEALAVCGARNAFDDLPGVAPSVPWELVHARDPWAIVGAGSAAGPAEFAERWQARATLGAVRAGRLVFVEADAIQRPSLRLAEGVRQLCEGLDRLR